VNPEVIGRQGDVEEEPVVVVGDRPEAPVFGLVVPEAEGAVVELRTSMSSTDSDRPVIDVRPSRARARICCSMASP
jgi:hypothetical protein